MVTSSANVFIRSSWAVAETRGRSRAAQTSDRGERTAEHARHGRGRRLGGHGEHRDERAHRKADHARSRVRWWRGRSGPPRPSGALLTVVVRAGGRGAARLGFLVPGPQPYAGEMTSTATAAAGPDNDWADITASEASLRRFLHGLPGVDQVGAEARAAGARDAVDQDHRQGLRHRPGDPDGRPHDPGGPGHPRQGARARREGDAARSRRPDLPVHRRRLRLPRPGRDGEADAGHERRPRRLGRDGVPERSGVARGQARRRP